MDHGTNVDSAAYINLDGFTVPGRFLYGLGAAERDSVRVGECLERPFQFAVSKAGMLKLVRLFSRMVLILTNSLLLQAGTASQIVIPELVQSVSKSGRYNVWPRITLPMLL